MNVGKNGSNGNGTMRRASSPQPIRPAAGRGSVVITGGAGFIGSNLADRLLGAGEQVVVFDNLSRPGVEQNLRWLKARYPESLRVEIGDIRDRYALRQAVQNAKQVFHFAAQVAVTTSLHDPVADFEINARGTLNLLEELRGLPEPPPVVFTSTNKVYGELKDIRLQRNGTRYIPRDREIESTGVGEERLLDFHSPYGCSKGAADQYVLDYARVYGMPAVVFRMSCIYGPHQFGTEDQGWIAHFLIRAIDGEPVTLYGDGMQVRDALFVDDLLDAFELAQKNIGRISGQAFNIGGGPANTVSLLELMRMIGELHASGPQVIMDEWRTGDQRYYVSDIRRFQAETGWAPKTSFRDGLRRLYEWLLEHRGAARRTYLAGRGAQ